MVFVIAIGATTALACDRTPTASEPESEPVAPFPGPCAVYLARDAEAVPDGSSQGFDLENFTLAARLTYSDSGHPIRLERFYHDGRPSGRWYQLAIDAAGHRTSERSFYEDQLLTEAHMFYDVAGRRERVAVDYDLDGQADLTHRAFFDAEGQLIATEVDEDQDGAADFRSEYSYDARGRVVRRLDDVDMDGAFDHETRFEYDGDPRCGTRGPILVPLMSDGDVLDVGELQRCPTRVVSERRADAVIELVTRYQYSPEGNLVSERRVLGGVEGPGTISASYDYDAAGNRVEVLRASGAKPVRVRYDYRCWDDGPGMTGRE